MNPNTEELLFQLALTKSGAKRGAWLDRECGEDKSLRARLEALLAYHDATANLLHTAAGTAPTIKLDLADAPDEAVGQTLGRYKLLEQIGEGGCGMVYVAEQTESVRGIKVCQAIQHVHQKGIIHREIKPSNILGTLHDGPAGAGVPEVIDFGIAKATEGRLADNTVYTQLHQFIGTPAYMSPEQAEMSPAAVGEIDTRSDIYSLGVLLYELLAGSTPFEHLTHENNLHHHRAFHHPPRRCHPLCQRR